MPNKIFNTLKKLKLTSLSSRELFFKETRDKKLKVWKDIISEVIYIDDNLYSNRSYFTGNYREENLAKLNINFYPHYERFQDTERRFKSLLKYVCDKNVLDIGCGYAEFLKKIKPFAKSVKGIEIQNNLIDMINEDGIECYDNLKKIDNASIDTCTLFHSFEHINDPFNFLINIKKKIIKGGLIIIEVPHARDILLNDFNEYHFKKFSLWSQHLILHTRKSIYSFLNKAGFNEIYITGIQRYPLSNHLHWLVNKKQGGHKNPLSIIDTDGLTTEYEKSLSKIDATDTLLLIAKNSF